MSDISFIKSPMGLITLVATDDFLLSMYVNNYQCNDNENDEDEDEDEDEDDEPNAILQKAKDFLIAYFEGNPVKVEIPLAGYGTKFQNVVWNEVQKIPFGSVCTYQDIATRLGHADARTVGAAVHNNHFPIIVPCHRVLPKNGKFSGHKDEIKRKLWLLNFEKEMLENQN